MNSQILTVADLRITRAGYSRAATIPFFALPYHVAIPSGRLALFAALSLADLCLTWVLLTNGGGVVYESNPLANTILMNYGWSGIVLFKFADMLAVAWITLVLCFIQPKIGRRVLSLACGIVGAVILYSSCLALLYV
jgi:hypothetical protein